jgi:hypothetical protein
LTRINHQGKPVFVPALVLVTTYRPQTKKRKKHEFNLKIYMDFMDYGKAIDYGEQKFALKELKTKGYKINTVE